MSGNGHKLLTAEREQRIMQLLHDSDVVTVSAISEALGMSEATVRRDLQAMHERGLLERVHGGAAVKQESSPEPLFSDKEEQFSTEKQRIAAAALSLIHDHDTIFLDGGSTVLMLARMLDSLKALTIVTNSLMAAAQLMESPHRLILTGGEFRAISRTLVGPLSSPILKNIVVDKAFMGTMGFTTTDGMSTTDANEAYTKTRVMERARQVILLADRSKLGCSSFVTCGPDWHLDVLVTDAIDPKTRQELEERDIRVIVAGKNATAKANAGTARADQ
ncbi:DeoR/GlpR family DNA-binding transcription regulator [Oligosphaera ethanolica]|jgi:DeoR/GlpR family transcriptional regulator of sugar metabolism|uniref:DeoR/GlpR family transcriptional regulator of sugar metabolism n=1 Tax=Oligosphaera ethanolica TaxID=760260 RepID=A0AAE3VH57_9BACT|nr:DeoR/GlpR family DNA-binding transcription regulator [Oligosphaera ethanolica]MDQ0290213.1 DeoR/GlpR family transcriptional regulator of sugar metabolism [Oligosphaera ethanolica]NLE56112.1 DeoR/GlpR transcriptional regulator [Lentisphaerota bacterium]